MPYIVSVVARKGGVAKTTTAVNLAASLARAGASVLVVDADSQGQCADLLGVSLAENDLVFADWMRGNEIASCALVPVSPASSFGPALLPGDNQTLGFESKISPVGLLALADRLRAEAAAWDYVIIDSPPKGLMQDWAILAADLCVLPAPANALGARMALDAFYLAALVPLKAGRYAPARVVLPVMVQAGTRDGRRWLAAINEQFAGFLAPAAVPLAVVVAESAAAGVPLVAYAPKSLAAVAYGALWRLVDMLRVGADLEVA